MRTPPALLVVIFATAFAGCEIVAGIKDRSRAAGAGGNTGTAGGGSGGHGGSGGNGGAQAPALGHIGDACASVGAFACDGTNSEQLLICNGQIWSGNGRCPANQRCDSRPGAGQCGAVVPACVGKLPGAATCVGSEIHTCGPDLVTSNLVMACSELSDPAAPDCVNGACACAGMMCGNVCAHLDSDHDHCGRCDRPCDGACANGLCQGVVLVSGQTAISGIAVNASSVYWTVSTTVAGAVSVYRVAVRGGPISIVARDHATTGGIAVDATHVYWTSTSPAGSLWKIDLDSLEQARALAPAAPSVGRVVVRGTDVYWARGGLWRVDTDGNGPTSALTMQGGSLLSFSGLAADATQVYWGAMTGLMRSDRTGSMAAALAAIPVVVGVAVGGETVYYASGMGGGIGRVPKNGGATETLTNGANPRDLVFDGTYLYWPEAGAIRKIDPSGGEPTNVTQASEANRIAVDATHVYWSTDTGQILRVEK